MTDVASAVKSAGTRVWNRAFTSIFISYILVNLSLNMSNNLSTPYAKSLGATPVLLGIVATGFTYGAMVFKLASAPAIDSFNRKWVLFGAVGVIGVAFVGYSISTTVPVLITFRVIQGIGQAFTATCFIALAADTLPREKLASGMGIFATGTAVATMLGALIVLKVQEATNYRVAFLFSFVVLALGALAISRIKIKPLAKKKFRISFKGFIAPEALPPAAIQLLFMLAWSSVFAFLIVFGQEQGLGSNVGLFNTVYGLAVFAAAPLGGRLIDRYGYLMMIPMLVFMSAALWLISYSTELWILLLAAACGALGYGAAGPVVRSMAMAVVPKSRRGAASSTLYLASDIGQLVGPILGGLIIASYGYETMYRVAPVYVVLALLLIVFSRGYVKNRSAKVAAAEKDEEAAAELQSSGKAA